LLHRAGMARGKVRTLRKRPEQDQVHWVDARGARSVDARRFRDVVGPDRLYSSRFSAVTRNGRVELRGAGFGHGVGMCQWGARGMARQGKSYGQILGHYYQGAGIRRAY